MKTFYYLGVFAVSALLTGCGGMGGTPSNPPPASGVGDGGSHAVSDVINAGDKITIRLAGVPDDGYITEVQIPASGEVSVPLLSQPFQAIGHTTDDLAAQITAAYKNGKIYTNPVVTVLPEEKFLSIGGDVRSPTRIVYTPGMTLMGAINQCGGFTEYANKHAVRIIRGQQVMVVDCVKAIKIPGTDPLVYPGDQINIPRTIF